MIKFEYDDDGNLIAYKDGKMVGQIDSMGDDIGKKEVTKDEHRSHNDRQQLKGKKRG